MIVAPDVGLKFFTVKEIAGSLLLCESVKGIGYGEVVRVLAQDGDEKVGQVIDVSDEVTVIQIYE
ncbi:MAG: hypothetical protein NWE80_03130, partial [Candidatus Bathyarchaeota archaeon]|nr:hypothetical protein [Candidatus Bathyarchaeota archaeon]